jgi:hypothetical protein
MKRLPKVDLYQLLMVVVAIGVFLVAAGAPQGYGG